MLIFHTSKAMNPNGVSVTTDPGDTTGVKFLIAFVELNYFNGAGGLSICNGIFCYSDLVANTWTELVKVTTAGDGWLRTFICNNPTTSSVHTFDVTTNTFRNSSIIVLGFDDTLTLPFNYSDDISFPASNINQTVGDYSSDPGNCLAITAFGLDYRAPGITGTVNNGFTIAEQISALFPHNGLAAAYRLSSYVQTNGATWTLSSANQPGLVFFSYVTDNPIPVVLSGSGIYKLVPGKLDDTLFDTIDNSVVPPTYTTRRVKIP